MVGQGLSMGVASLRVLQIKLFLVSFWAEFLPSEMDIPLCIGAHEQHDNIWQKEVNAIKT